jgi:hypothetical protein
MAKISEGDRNKYHQRIQKYQLAAKQFLAAEKSALAADKKSPRVDAEKKLALAEDMLDLASNYIAINGISVSVLKTKDDDALNDGRKSLYKSVIYLEDVVSNFIDAPFSDYEEKTVLLENVNSRRRFDLIRKMGLAIQLLENAYGRNTKWRWAFVELEGRYAAAAKNIFDLRGAVTNTDPRSPDYEPSVLHLRLIKRLLIRAANRYRERYELSTNHIDDFKMGIAFLSALKRLNAMISSRAETETVRKKLLIWQAKLEADIKKKEELYLEKAGSFL